MVIVFLLVTTITNKICWWSHIFNAYINTITHAGNFMYLWSENGIHITYAIIVALLFIPLMYVIYNELARIYTAIYGAIVLIGNLIGLVLRKAKIQIS